MHVLSRCRLGRVAASSLNPGMIVKTEPGSYIEVTGYQHLKSSQGKTSSIIEYLNMSTLKYGKYTASTDREFEVIDLNRVEVLVQYTTDSHLIACDARTFEEVCIPLHLVKPVVDLLTPGTGLTLLVHEDDIIKIALPTDMLAKVQERKIS